MGGRGVLFMHEVHTVRGRAEDDFEAAFRDGWMPMLGAGDDARLLWYTNHAHGSGPAYTVVTVTAVRDGAAWERLPSESRRATSDSGCATSMSCATMWRPNCLCRCRGRRCKDMDFDEVPADGREHELTLYMEDTMWPYEDKFA